MLVKYSLEKKFNYGYYKRDFCTKMLSVSLSNSHLTGSYAHKGNMITSN